MATGGAPSTTGGPLLWEKENGDEQEAVCHSSLRRVLNDARVKFKDTLRVDDLWANLEKLNVLTHTDVERLRHTGSRPDAVEALMNHLARSPRWHFHGLMRACVLTHQEHLLGQIGLIVDDYKAPPQTPSEPPIEAGPFKRLWLKIKAFFTGEKNQPPPPDNQSEQSPTSHPAQLPESLRKVLKEDNSIRNTLPPDLVTGIEDHAEYYKHGLMRSNMYDLADSPAARRINIAKIYIEVSAKEEQQDGNLMEIPERDIFNCLPGETSLKVIRLYGPPGTGKTALGRHIVYDWSQDLLNRLKNSLPLDCFSTMVYIPAREITGSVEEAIEEHLWCKKDDKKTLSKHVKSGEGIGMVLDAIDEVRDPAVMNNIRKFIEERQKHRDGPRVLVTARTDLCELNSSLFDRFLVVKGFSEDQAIEYIRAYMHGESLLKMLKYVQSQREKLYAVLTNPLRLHIFCALVSEGVLKLEETDDFSIFKLFVLLEQFLIRREGEIVTKEQSNRFYEMCMLGLIQGLRSFPEQLLKEFDIPKGYLVFLERADKERATGRQVSFSFPHEMMNEFFAARYIETLPLASKKSLLLSVCSQPTFRNLQKILFEVILQQELHQHELLQMMLRAILILQHTEQETQSTDGMSEQGEGSRALYDELVLLKKKVQPPESAEKLWREHQQDVDLSDVDETCNRINNVFDNHPGGLKELKWYRGLGNGVLGHTAECIQSSPPKQRELLAKATTGHLLPYDYKDTNGHHFVMAVGTSRWSEAVIGKGTIEVNAWCPEDAKEALQKVRLRTVMSHNKDTFKPITLNMSMYRSVWEQPPSSAFTPDVCKGLTDELQHWSETCNSQQFVLAVGTSRYTEVVINTEQKMVDVHAWCMDDAKEALQEVRLSHLSSLHTVNTLTLDITKYRDLWGEPPSSATSSQVSRSAELQQWSDTFESYHFVCGVATSRCGEVVINTQQKTVNAWCLEDAKEALQQVRFSGVLSLYKLFYRPITLNIGWKTDVWGQPPSSAFTPDVCNGLTDALQHGYNQFNRHHIVCSVGTARYAEVVLEGDDATVRAWCVEDATEAVHQVRTSPDTKDPVWNRLGRTFNIHINTSDSLWQRPPSSDFSPDIWKTLVVEVQYWGRVFWVNSIHLGKTTPLQGLLLSGATTVGAVYYGTVDLEELYRLWHTGQLKYVWELHHTNIVVADSADQAALRHMRDKLVQAVGADGDSLLNNPQFVTRTGAEYQWRR